MGDNGSLSAVLLSVLIYNTLKRSCPGSRSSSAAFVKTYIKDQKSINIQINSLLKQCVNLNHDQIKILIYNNKL